MRKRFPIAGTTAAEPVPAAQATGKITIRDVASRAGVSPATVSKYLGNRDYYISQEARKKIQQAITDLDYEPNAAARALARQRSEIIGVVVPSIVNPYYPELIAGIEEVTGEQGYTLTFATTDHALEREEAALATMRQQRVAGLILGVTPAKDALARFVESGTEIVMVSREADDSGLEGVQVDNVEGAILATRHLAEHGHQRIALITGPQEASSFKDRARGYRRACDDLGLEPLVVEVAARFPTMADGHEACRELLATHQPTAVLVCTDLMALGVLGYCAESGNHVPDDLAVIGFDNIWVSRLPSVALSTVDGATRDVGRQAARRLLKRLSTTTKPNDTQQGFTLLSPTLIKRRSCGCT